MAVLEDGVGVELTGKSKHASAATPSSTNATRLHHLSLPIARCHRCSCHRRCGRKQALRAGVCFQQREDFGIVYCIAGASPPQEGEAVSLGRGERFSEKVSAA
jgi:hypothetical protein